MESRCIWVSIQSLCVSAPLSGLQHHRQRAHVIKDKNLAIRLISRYSKFILIFQVGFVPVIIVFFSNNFTSHLTAFHLHFTLRTIKRQREFSAIRECEPQFTWQWRPDATASLLVFQALPQGVAQTVFTRHQRKRLA